MSEPVAEQPVVAPVDDSVPATTEQPADPAPAATTEETPKVDEPASTEAAAVETPKTEKRKSKILDLFSKIKVD